MCGGIVGLLHAQIPAGRGALAIGFHVGRIASYTVIGLIATGLGMLPAALVPAGAPQVMRLLLGAIIVAMAVYIALPGRFRDVAGQLAAPVTRRMMPFFGRFLPVKSLDNAIGLGLLWGFFALRSALFGGGCRRAAGRPAGHHRHDRGLWCGHRAAAFGQRAAHAQIPLGHQPARAALAGGRPAGAYRAADRAGAVAGPPCGPAVDSVSGGLRDLTPGVRDRDVPTTAARP